MIVPTPEIFDALVDEYMEQHKNSSKPPTLTGMALHMGFSNRTTMFDYAHRPEFQNSVARAKALIEQWCEERLLLGQNIGGPIFYLCQPWMGWQNPRYTVQHEGEVQHQHAHAHAHRHTVDWGSLDDATLEQVARVALPPPRNAGMSMDEAEVIDGEVVYGDAED